MLGEDKQEVEEVEESVDRNVLWMNDPEYQSNEHKLVVSTLEKLGKNLRDGVRRMVNAWNPNERLGPDYFKVTHVQELFNFSRQCVGAIKMFKKKSIQGGIAYYDDEGKFKWKDEDGINEA